MSKNIERVCEHCGTLFKVKPSVVKRGWGRFCSLSCSNTRAKVERTCEGCGKVFYVMPSKVNKGSGKYCSSTCFHVAQKTKKASACAYCRKEFIPQRSTIKYCSTECHRSHYHITAPCKQCGKEFTKRRSDRRQQDFCSKECRLASKRVEKTCKQCDERFTLTIGRINLGQPGIFCSRRCMGDWMSVNKTGENATRWRGGTIRYYGPNWERQREEARKRDNYTCQDCKITEQEFGKKLEVHHKKPFKRFGYIPNKNDSYEQANDLDNLITLCIPCHKKAEKLVIRHRAST